MQPRRSVARPGDPHRFPRAAKASLPAPLAPPLTAQRHLRYAVREVAPGLHRAPAGMLWRVSNIRSRAGGRGSRSGRRWPWPPPRWASASARTPRSQGWPPLATIIMSAVVLSGSAQFAFITALSGGAGLLTGIGAASLMNLRFVPMAAASARSLHGGRIRRAFEGQTVVDGSWVPAQRPDGSTDREMMIAATFVQWPAWILGTAAGALLVPSAEFLHRFGLDVDLPLLLPDPAAGGAQGPPGPPLDRPRRLRGGRAVGAARAGRGGPAAVRAGHPARPATRAATR